VGAAIASATGVGAARADQTPGPGPRAGHAMAWHAGIGAICLIGGDRPGVEAGAPREQVWLWNGRAWTTRSAGEAPHAASLVAAVADVERRSVFAYGGFRIEGPRKYGAPAGELWELDHDLVWRRHDGEGPGPRHHHAMAFDAARGRLVLYGGLNAANEWMTDLWEWDRRAWRRVDFETGPGQRAHHAMAFDERRGRIVLRGGTRADKVRPLDTWEWDGRAWRLAAADGPGPGGGYRMAFDAARGVTVLCGGDTCLWDGGAWTKAESARAPAHRMVHSLAYDRDRRVVVLYGGSVDGENVGDTWEWNGAAWSLI